MDALLLVEPVSAGFVVGGTLLATVARSGLREVGLTVRQVGGLFGKPFLCAQHRAELAGQVELMRHDGIMRGNPGPLSDPEFSDATAALIRHRSTGAMAVEHERHYRMREVPREKAVQALNHAGELAPVLGLAGTLLALSQLPESGLASGSAVMGSVSMAVVSTFYGLLLAHLFFHPLAAAIERRGRLEEAEREELKQWLLCQLQPACAPARSVEDRVPTRVEGRAGSQAA